MITFRILLKRVIILIPFLTQIGYSQSITLTLSHTNITCSGLRDGSVSAICTGGTAPYTYTWSNGETTSTISNLSGGYYHIVISDVNDERAEGEITLLEPERLATSIATPRYYNGYNVSCHFCFDGQVYTSVEGGVPPYSYFWSDGAITNNRTNLNAGNFQLLITDANGCSNQHEFGLSSPDREDWQTFGNVNINPSSNFIGTTDSSTLSFKTNNIERFRINANGVSSFSGILNLNNSLTFNNDKSITYQHSQGGIPSIFSIGSAPNNSAFSISSCSLPFLNTQLNYQFNGSIQLYGNSISGNNLNILELGFDGANSIIEATGSTLNPIYNRLLINYTCGRDVFICTGSNGGNIQLGNNNSSIGIGTSNFDPAYRLLVNGSIRTKKIVVDIGWSDYVFQKGYKLLNIEDLERFITSNQHLPNMPSAKEIEENG